MSANTSDLGATQYETKGELGKSTPAGDAVRQTIAGLLGHGVAVEELSLQGHNRPTKYTGIHTTQGIPLMLSGQADVVQVDLSEKVAAYPDPIKLILQFLYTEGRKVVITKRTVTGGGIGVVPERTRGQVASMQVETRSEVLTRYGGDITMNLNAWLKPAEAAAELSGKLAAQRRELEKTLVRIGYETVMKSGTPMLDAIINSNSVYGMQNRRGDPAAKRFAEQVYAKSLFGALSRFKYPLPNLLAAARKASAYRPGNAGVPSILILPHGLPAMSDYIKPEKMKFKLSGLDYREHETLDLSVQNVYTDPATNIKIMAHIPPVNTYYGTGAPTSDASLLSRKVGIISAVMTSRKGDGGQMAPDQEPFIFNLEAGEYQRVSPPNRVRVNVPGGGAAAPQVVEFGASMYPFQATVYTSASIPGIGGQIANPQANGNRCTDPCAGTDSFHRVTVGTKILDTFEQGVNLQAVVRIVHREATMRNNLMPAAPAPAVGGGAGGGHAVNNGINAYDPSPEMRRVFVAIAAAYYSKAKHTDDSSLAFEFFNRAAFFERVYRMSDVATNNGNVDEKIAAVKLRAKFMFLEIIGRMVVKAFPKATLTTRSPIEFPQGAEIEGPTKLVVNGDYFTPVRRGPGAHTVDDATALLAPYDPNEKKKVHQGNTHTDDKRVAGYRLTVLRMGAGILACDTPAENGKLMMAFPFSDVYSSQEDWELRTRVYMGGCVEVPENILIMHDIAFEGVISDRVYGSIDEAQKAGDREGVEHYAGDPRDPCTTYDKAGGAVATYSGSPLGWLDSEEGFPIVTGMQVYSEHDEIQAKRPRDTGISDLARILGN